MIEVGGVLGVGESRLRGVMVAMMVGMMRGYCFWPILRWPIWAKSRLR